MRPFHRSICIVVLLTAMSFTPLCAQGAASELRFHPYASFLSDQRLAARPDTTVLEASHFSTGGAVVGGLSLGLVGVFLSRAVYCDGQEGRACTLSTVGGALVGGLIGVLLGGAIGDSFAGD